ncbi:MAG TPA: retropepsin-like aspartic protease [Steroidobacteraceae bacterium]
MAFATKTSFELLAAISLGIVLFSAAHAAADPTMHQIYEAATTGHLDQAQEMISQVLKNHPNSAKAHWVQAEVYAKANKTNMARDEVLEAERLNPGLTKISAKAVRELKTELGLIEGGETRIPLVKMSGGLIAPVVINNALKLNFVVDSGASDVSIPTDVFSRLVRANTVTRADLTGTRPYKNADGQVFHSQTFIIRSLKLGNIEAPNVQAKVSSSNAPPLLGQSFLKRFKSWSIDNATQELILQR